MRVLIVEDDDSLRGILVKRLKAEGYAVDACANGIDGLDYAQAVMYYGIILDIMMPGIKVYVRYLRGKIDKDETVKLLHTVRGFGYVLKSEEGVP